MVKIDRKRGREGVRDAGKEEEKKEERKDVI
jgi:hypothetical protein